MGVSAAELPIPSSLDDKPGTENDAKPAKNGTDWLLGLIRSLEATKATYTKKLDSIDPTQCVHLVDKERQDLRIAVSHLMKTLEKINEL